MPMEKWTPHNKLSVVKGLVLKGQVQATGSALAGAAALGLGFHEIMEVVMALESKDFYKSMTTHRDHTLWQDVYRPVTRGGKVYLKFTVQIGVLIVSFKEL